MSAQANPNYRVEHVAPVPRGWKVRTKMSATHMLRIAFPPGRRRRGSGKVVEIFHPVNENPCAMRNPAVGRGTQERKDTAESLRITRRILRGKGLRREVSEFSRRRLGHRNPMDAFTKKHLADWLQRSVHSSERRHVGKMIRDLVARDPQLVETHGWPEIRAMAEKENPRGRRNPSATESAAALYESFHGQSPREILEMQESDAARHTYAALGDLRELVIDAPAGKVKIGFDGSDAVKVASAPGGKQLYLIGGNQNLDSQLGRFGSDPAKDFVELGAATQITYRARKSFDKFQMVDYYHDLGEETKEPPFAFYDRLKHRIFLAGGRYRVEAPGIIN